MNPFSDLDIMFLHSKPGGSSGRPGPYVSAVADGVLYPLWDIGLKIGHSVRSLQDCVQIANSDLQSKTALIEARLVAGDEGLFLAMQTAIMTRCVRGQEDAYIGARVKDQEERRARFGNSPFMQEPNIKNGCGGLRDYQNLLWMSFFKYRIRSLEELAGRGLINKAEQKQLDAAYDFLLRIRNQLHYQACRAADVLSRSLQPGIASNLAYSERSPRKRIERFMRDVYMHMRNVFLITRTLERRLALLPQPARLPSLRALIRTGRRRALQQHFDGFIFYEGEVFAGSDTVFREEPRRLMRVFLYAQQRGLKLHPDLSQMVRQHLSLVNRQFLRDSHVHDTFLEILNQRGNVAPIIRAMHEVDFLGKYLPEFGRLTCLVQHEFYHQYTADEHTVVCVEKLDRIWAAKEPPLHYYAELFQRLERPSILYLALLLHDSGKANPSGNHAEVSGRLALRVARRLGLDGATTHTLRMVVECHLDMIQISQRRDIDDPGVIRNFAAQMQTPENLMLLTLHTLADSQGTSPELWNGFKDSLLQTLSRRTLQVLEGGPGFLRAEEKVRDLLMDEVRQLMPPGFHEDELQAHFDHLPLRYFQIHSARQVLADLAMAHRFMHLQIAEADKALEPVVDWHTEPDRGYTAVQICTWDRTGLFSKIVGGLTASGLNILSAQIFTRTDGIILDTFFVIDARSGLAAKQAEREKFESLLRRALTGELSLSASISRQQPSNALRPLPDEEQIPTVIRFDNETSDYYTLVEIETEDRVGLLHRISQTFSELNIDIAIAKICTEKGAAVDSFYVTTQENRKIESQSSQQFVAEQLRQAIASLDAS
jgi:[protein-PII] uridylyltransferase